MTKIKICGLSRPSDIDAANELGLDYIGFVFAEKSKRYVTFEQAAELKKLLAPGIQAVGVFVNEKPETIADLLDKGVIDMAQVHGSEDEAYIETLRKLTDKPIIQAFRIKADKDLVAAQASLADYILLDSGAGTGKTFDWELIRKFNRPYFLAGGLGPDNVGQAIEMLQPEAVDVSSGVERDGLKDRAKMAAFVAQVRKEGLL